MIDPRFFTNLGPFSLGELADKLAWHLPGSAPRDLAITDLAPLDEARPSEISMFADSRYSRAFEETKAGAVLTSAELARNRQPKASTKLIPMDSPRLGFAQAAYLFYPATSEILGLDDDRANATVGGGCQISSSARIGTGATIGAGTMVGANAVIGNGVTVGENCLIGPNVTISHAVIGKRVQIYPGVVIGTQGFGFVPGPQGMLRIPQLGRVVIGDDVEIGSNSTIDRGAIGDTVIGNGTVIDNQVQVGHNVQIGRSCILSGQSGVAGSTRIEDGVQIGGGSSITGHITIGAGARIAGKSGVAQDVEAGSTVGGYPAIPIRNWHRQTIGLERMFSRKT